MLLAAGGGLFAQGTAARAGRGGEIALSFDLEPLLRANLLEEDRGGLGGALNVEFFIAPTYSVGLRAEGLMVPDVDRFYFGADGHFRFYVAPGGLIGPFVDMSVGWGGLFDKDSPDAKTGLRSGGLTYSLKLGYKQALWRGFFVEPGLSYTLAKPSAGYGPAGFDLSLAGGYVFAPRRSK
jgi:hypothetical protein